MLNSTLQTEFIALRKQVIANEYQNLNPQQQQAVLTTQGPLLLLAGAGSGKTTVLIHRIANLMRYGKAADSEEVPDFVTEDDVQFLKTCADAPALTPEQAQRREQLCALNPAAPWQILAITFTNKAAEELKLRLEKMLGTQARDVWASTFHSACVRILRRDIEKLGFSSSFTIYDTDDSLRVVKECLRQLELDDKQFVPRSVLGYISRAKDDLQLAEDYAADCEKSGDFRLIKIAKVYTEYQRRLWQANALDFDDIILHTVRLLQKCADVREYYQKKFHYVLIDEYQDTNNLQYLLASTLAGGYKNFCVVGDDDQSIYRFRGATIENILSFEQQYKGARVIRLEENYRSTGHILQASNAVIANNQGRKGKQLWTKAQLGEKLTLHSAANEHDEARYVADTIMQGYAEGRRWREHAILYRMNAQSNQMETACKRNGIPYRIIGGTKFFDRAEVKDMLAYLAVLNQPDDNLRLERIVNNPPRGIGDRTIEIAKEIAVNEGRTLYEVIDHARQYPQLERAAGKLAVFTNLMQELSALLQALPLDEFYEKLIERTGYAAMLQAKDTVENRSRLENVRELLTTIRGYLENAEGSPTLAGFLDEIALYTDLDSHDPNQDCVVMMTMHAAKGLEFPVVFVVGAEEGIFPGIRAIGEQEEMEEERRLCYVAMTRAKQRLYLTCAGQRMLFGRTSANLPSRFVKEIPEQTLERTGATPFGADESGYAAQHSSATFGGYQRQAAPTQPSTAASYGGFTNAMSQHSKRTASAKQGTGASKPAGAPLPALQKDDVVSHTAFGQGTVLSVQKMGGDALVEIAFESAGTKRLMLKAAAQHLSKV